MATSHEQTDIIIPGTHLIEFQGMHIHYTSQTFYQNYNYLKLPELGQYDELPPIHDPSRRPSHGCQHHFHRPSNKLRPSTSLHSNLDNEAH